MNNRQCESGFTLLELLVALVVLAIVMTLVVPAFDRILARNRLATTTNDLLAAMLAARTTAITRNVPVVFCAGEPIAGCHGDWTRAEWIAFVDGNRSSRLDDGDTLHLADHLPSAGTVALAGNGPFRNEIVFRPSGLARTAGGAFAAGRLRVCVVAPLESNANDLVLIGSGRAVSESHDFSGSCPEL